MHFLRPSLRFIWVPALAMALVVVALYLMVRWWVAADLAASSQVRVEQRSLLLAAEVESSMDSVHLQLRQLARRLATQPGGAQGQARSDLEWLQTRSKAFAWIGLASPAGIVLAGSSGWLEGESVRDRPVFTQARQGPYTGDFHPAVMLRSVLPPSQQGLPAVADIGIPIHDARGQLQAVLMAHIHQQWLLSLGERIVSQPEQERLGFRWFLLDSRGQPLNDSLPFKWAPSLGHWSGVLTSHGERSRFYVSARPLTVGSASSPLQWTAVAALRSEEAAAPLHAFDRRLAAASIVAFVLAGLLALLLSQRLMRPYDRLLQVVSERYRSATPATDFTGHLDALSRELEQTAAAGARDAESALLMQVARDASQLRHLLDSLPVAVCIIDDAHRVLYANALFGRYLGHLPPQDSQACIRRLAGAAHRPVPPGGAIPQAAVAEISREEGGVRAVAVGMEPLRRDAPEGPQVLVLRDVSREHQAGQAAQEAHQRMQALTDAVRDHAFIVLDGYGIVRSWSHGGEQIFGWPREAALGLPFSQVFAVPAGDGQYPSAEDILRDAIDQSNVSFEAPMRRADGRHFMARGTAYALHERQDEASVAVILSDATHVIESARRLQESEQRLAAIVAGATDAVISIDAGSRITLFNPAAERIFGRRAIDVVGRPLDLLLPAQARHAHAGWVGGFGKSGVTRRGMGQGTVHGLRSDGARIELQASISKASVHGHMVYTAILRDVTDQIASRRREEHLQQERAALTHRLFHQEKETSRRLALSLHDELGQTIGALRLFFDAQAAQLEAQGIRSPDLQRLDDLLDRLNGQIRSVLADLRPPLLDELGLVAALENEAQSGVFDPMRVHLNGDPSRRWPPDVEWCAFLVAREALTNARRHSGADSADVLIEGDDHFLRLAIIDNGRGMDGLAHRAHPGHLGLVGMRERAAAIGAHLDIESSPDSGTEVCLEWRRAP